MAENQITRNIEDIIAEERKAYFKNWRSKNKERVKEHNRRFWEKRAINKTQQEGEKNAQNENS